MLVTTNSALPGRTYYETREVRAGCYPCLGPSSSSVVNAYAYALSQLEWQAAEMGADAVIGVHVVRADRHYVLLAGKAIWLDYPEYRVEYRVVYW